MNNHIYHEKNALFVKFSLASMPVARPVPVAKPEAPPPKPATPPPVAAPASVPAAAGNDAVAAQLEALTKMVSELAAKNKALEARLGDVDQ